jgi:predicted deacylase
MILFAPLGAVGAWEKSPHTEHVYQLMRQWAEQNPQNAKIIEIGRSDGGRGIQALEVGSGSVTALVVGTHHGNEYGSTEVAKAVAKSLSEEPIRDLKVIVVPVLNLDGFDTRNRLERGRDGRYHDPNRDYPGPCGSDGPFRLSSTRALAELLARENVVTSATLHTYSPMVGYPFGFSTQDKKTPYDGIFEQLGQAAAAESRYPVGNSGDLVYPADGTFEDYAFVEHGVWSLLFELGFSHRPDGGAIEEMIRVNVPGIRRFLETAPRERAERHAFEGRCDTRLRIYDRRDE